MGFTVKARDRHPGGAKTLAKGLSARDALKIATRAVRNYDSLGTTWTVAVVAPDAGGANGAYCTRRVQGKGARAACLLTPAFKAKVKSNAFAGAHTKRRAAAKKRRK